MKAFSTCMLASPQKSGSNAFNFMFYRKTNVLYSKYAITTETKRRDIASKADPSGHGV